MCQLFNTGLLLIQGFDLLREQVQVLAPALRHLPGFTPLDDLARDPHQQHADQRLQQHVAGRAGADIFAVQRTEQAVQVMPVLACGVTGNALQGAHRPAQLGLQLRHQRRGQRQHKAFNVR